MTEQMKSMESWRAEMNERTNALTTGDVERDRRAWAAIKLRALDKLHTLQEEYDQGKWTPEGLRHELGNLEGNLNDSWHSVITENAIENLQDYIQKLLAKFEQNRSEWESAIASHEDTARADAKDLIVKAEDVWFDGEKEMP